MTQAAQQRAQMGNNEGSGWPQCGGTQVMALCTQHISVNPKCFISKRVSAPHLWVGLPSCFSFYLRGKNTEMGKNLMGIR